MKRFYPGVIVLAITLMTISCLGNGSESEKTVAGIYDGPYIIYDGIMATIYRLEGGLGGPKLVSEYLTAEALKEKRIDVYPDSEMPPFSVRIFNYSNEPAIFIQPRKTFVVSDIEGNFVDFVKILFVAGVIDKDYNWRYGSNHLVINGDLFDRGTDVLAVIWLCYKLDCESRESGGKVHLTLGNHDEMELRGNTKYLDKRYLDLSSEIGLDYKELFGENTELGRWLRTKNTVTIIGKTLFVHGGISEDVANLNLTAQEINDIARANLGNDKTLLDSIPALLWGDAGPFWYRGLFRLDERYFPISPDGLVRILGNFGVERIVIGHCIAPEITALHNGKVIAVDVEHQGNSALGKSRALLIQGNKLKSVNDKGGKMTLPVVAGFFQ